MVARVRDAAGNTTDSAKRTVTVDNTAPQTTIASAPASPTNATSASFSFSASEPGSSFECRLDGGAWTACSSPRAYAALAEGSHAFEVRATDPVGNADSTPATHTWVVDLTAPQTAIVLAPATPTNATTASFSFTAGEPGSTFACRLDGGAWSACTSPRGYSGLGEGLHAFEVRATDAAGNTDGSPAAHSWVVDTSAPDTTITSAPSSPTSSMLAGFSFAAGEGGATFECRLDGGGWATCASPTSYGGLAEGAHVFEVRAVDEVGNADPTPATHAWTVDLSPPQTTITGGVATPTSATSASIPFAASEAGSTFECRLDTAAWTPCSSPEAYAGVAEGPHTFEVRATDAAGNTDPTPASVGWVVDTSVPETAITSAPTDPTSATSATFSFISTESGSTFECRLDSGAWASCGSPRSLTGLSEGPHTFAVRATDPAGNTDPTPATHTWAVDLAAPETSITSTPADPSRFTEAAFTLSSSEPASTFECRLDAGAWSNCTSPTVLAGLSAGSHTFAARAADPPATSIPAPLRSRGSWTRPLPRRRSAPRPPTRPMRRRRASPSPRASRAPPSSAHWAGPAGRPARARTTTQTWPTARTFEVRATDAAGNVDQSPAARAWTVDTLPPASPTIESPAAGTTSATGTVTVSGTAEPGAVVELFEGATSRGTATTGPGGLWSRTLTGLSDGSHSYTATARDAAGNTSGASNSRTVVVDTTAPNTVLTTGPLGATSSTSASFTFAADDPSASFECRLDGSAWTACSSPRTYATLTEGSHTFEVRATDVAGNTDQTPALRTWTVDTTPPASPAITSPEEGATISSGTLTISGTAEPGRSSSSSTASRPRE